MDGKILPLDEVLAIAELPAKEVLQAQVLGTMLAPITSLAIVLEGHRRGEGRLRGSRCRARGCPRRVSIPAHSDFDFIILGGILPWLARRSTLSLRKLRP